MQTEQIRKKILKELPILLQTDTAFRDMVLVHSGQIGNGASL